MNIWHATKDDWQALSTIEAASYLAAEGASAESICGRLAHYPDHFWLLTTEADAGGEILAFVNGFVTDERDLTDEMYDHPERHDPNGAWQMIFSVVTAPAHRGEGCARQLLTRVLADAKAEGRQGIVLTCKERLLPFYAKFGFVDEGVSASVHGNVVWHQMRRMLHE